MKDRIIDKLKETLETISYCISLSWNSSKTYTLIRIGGKIISPFISIAIVVVGKFILDLLSGNMAAEEKTNAMIYLLLALVALNILNIVIQKVLEYAMGMHNDILSKEVRRKMMERGSHVDMEYFDDPNFHNMFTLAVQNMNSVMNVIWNSLDCISYFVSFIGTFLILCRVNAFYAILIILVSIPSAIANQKYIKDLFNINVSQVKDERKLNHLYDIATGKAYAEDVRLFNIGDRIRQRYLNLWNTLYLYRKKVVRKGASLIALLDILPQLLTFFFLLDITRRIIAGTGTVGDFSLYLGILGQLTMSIYIVSSSIMRIYDDKLRIDNVKKFDAIKNRIGNSGASILTKVENIEFRDVCFTYPNTDKLVLNHINFSIDHGEKVVLVGVNGAGKSTIIKLLMRFYDVDGGCIMINGLDIKDYELNSLRKSFSTYFQKPTVYGFSLKENVIIGDYNGYNDNDDKVLQSLGESDAIDIVHKLSNGLETYLTRNFEEDGAELSLGQYQKIALARTFFRSSSVILLDEPSSSLDPEAEHRIFESLNNLCKGKTTLFTSHRLSNVSIADKIVVIENGKIIEQGTHAQLIAEPKRYAKLFKYQADKFNMD